MRIATVPATHVYVRHLDDPRDPTVTRLMDPTGDDRRTPSFLDPRWWAGPARGQGIDVLHVHFGFEFYRAEQLAEVCVEARRQGVGIVHTVHDLRNPNHPTSELHDANLAVWMEHADELITLTRRTAVEIEEKFGRTATVLPHPHVAPLEELDRRSNTPRRRHADRVRVALHFKSLRANMFGAELLRSSLRALESEPEDVRLRVHLHSEFADPEGRNHDPELVDLAWRSAARSDARMDLHVHPYLSDDELWDLIAGAEVFVLPYRFGTHSGLLEACRDLGTGVVAPTFGGYLEQGAQFGFDVIDGCRLDETSFAAAIHAAIRAPRPQPVSPALRRQQRIALAAGHLEVYRRAIDAARRRRATAKADRPRTRGPLLTANREGLRQTDLSRTPPALRPAITEGSVAEDGIEVVTIVRGRETHLRNLVRGLAGSELVPDALTIVIMGGEDPTTQLPSVPFPIRRIWCVPERDDRLPLARARNVGLGAVRRRQVVFLDVDCIPGRRLLGEYARTLRERDVVAMGEVRYLEPDAVEPAWTEQDLIARSQPHPARAVPSTGGSCERYELFWSLSFASRTATLRRLGGFDEAYVGYGGEDTDLGYTLRSREVMLWWVPAAVAYHQHHESQSPPVQHLSAIVANARHFRSKWGEWPMIGWLQAFAEQGLVEWDPGGTMLDVRARSGASASEVAASSTGRVTG